jgi:hypothetical protein
MKARFVSLAVGYALAGGTLRRKGSRRRPWLEVRRLETEGAYLGSQARALRKASTPEARCVEDMVPGSAFYDICRLRFQHPWLERVMEICCPDDEQRVTPEALGIAGLRGLAQLWLDAGCWEKGEGRIVPRRGDDAPPIRAALAGLGIPSSAPIGRNWIVTIAPRPMEELAALLRPYVHRSMRHALRASPVGHGLALLPQSGLR